MLILKLDNVNTQIIGEIDNDILEEIDIECSYRVKGYQFAKAYKEGHWDGRKKLFHMAGRIFPTGLYSVVIKILKDNNIVYTTEDKRIISPKKFDLQWVFPFPLKEYQLEVITKSVKVKRGILDAATGGGKTLMALKIIQELGVKTLFIVNTREALNDTKKAMKSCFGAKIIKSNYFGEYSGTKKKIGEFLTIGTMACCHKSYQSVLKPQIKKKIPVNKRVKSDLELAGFNCIIADEVHHAGSDTWYNFILKIGAYHVFGLTGTNFRTDGADQLLLAVTGKPIGEIKTKQLQDAGHLTKSKVFFHEVTRPYTLNVKIDYSDVYTFGIVRNDARNNKIAEIAVLNKDKSTLILVEKIEHGEILERLLKPHIPGILFIKSKTKDRAQHKKDFEEGKIKTVIATRIYDESVDIPCLEVLIMAGSGKSGIKVIQRMGRVLRLFEGKDVALIHDFYDSFNSKLEDHSIERMRWIKKEKHSIVVLPDDTADDVPMPLLQFKPNTP